MSLRETLNKNSGLVSVIGGIVVVAAIGFSIYEYTSLFGNGATGAQERWYTVDDGKTLFTDHVSKIAPFDKDGKPALQAHVFNCGGKQVVGYLTRYTPEAVRVIEEARAAGKEGKPPPNMGAYIDANTNGMEFKMPGDKDWVNPKKASPGDILKFRAFRCPDGTMTGEINPD